jgi:hypothetical protein
MRSFRLALLAVTSLLAGAIAAPLTAQMTIQVVDANGRAVPAVQIDVLGRGELIGSAVTSAAGVAELSFERWAEAQRITLTHVGFQTLIVQVGDIPVDGVVRLEPQATAIEGLRVEARDLCPIDDDERARRLWSEVASRYSTQTGSRAWFAYLSRYGGAVREQDLHRVPDSGFVNHIAAGGPGIVHGGDHTPRSIDERVSTEGYAWPFLLIGGASGSRDLAWTYAELDRTHAYHFASAVFGLLHDFAVASESEGQTTLIFCGNGEGSGVTMKGIISLVPEEAFMTAEWRFETADRDENAGGSVSFESYVEGPGLKPHLVASRGLFFRHIGPERPYPELPMTYARFGTAKVRWYLLPSAEQPCNTGLSFHGDPPRSPEGLRFTECVTARWGRE